MHAVPVQKKRHPKIKTITGKQEVEMEVVSYLSQTRIKEEQDEKLRLHAVVLARAENNVWKIIFCAYRYAC